MKIQTVLLYFIHFTFLKVCFDLLIFFFSSFFLILIFVLVSNCVTVLSENSADRWVSHGQVREWLGYVLPT